MLAKKEPSFYNQFMPRVSQEHLDARRRQILDAARRRFIAEGFHETSMQDVLSESGLSTGAIYRYFRSKDEIIAAIVSEALVELAASLDDALDSGHPPQLTDAISRMLAVQQRLATEQDMAKLAVLIWGEAVRSPVLAAHVRDAHKNWRNILSNLIQEYQDAGFITNDIPADRIASTLTSILLGFMVQYAVEGDVDAEMITDGLRALLTEGPSSLLTVPYYNLELTR
jgi:AcrR family transcriptional regulator